VRDFWAPGSGPPTNLGISNSAAAGTKLGSRKKGKKKEEDEETIAAELRIEFGLRMLGNRCYQLRKFSSGMQQELDAQLDHQKRKHPISHWELTA
jgi:hypothetical protein